MKYGDWLKPYKLRLALLKLKGQALQLVQDDEEAGKSFQGLRQALEQRFGVVLPRSTLKEQFYAMEQGKTEGIMQFGQKYMLWVLLTVPVLIVLYFLARRRRARDISQIGDSDLLEYLMPESSSAASTPRRCSPPRRRCSDRPRNGSD